MPQQKRKAVHNIEMQNLCKLLVTVLLQVLVAEKEQEYLENAMADTIPPSPSWLADLDDDDAEGYSTDTPE